jgi:hypothetical protein
VKMPGRHQFCGYCELPVMKHKDSTGLIDGQLFHKRRCYPKYLKELKKARRRLEAASSMSSS